MFPEDIMALEPDDSATLEAVAALFKDSDTFEEQLGIYSVQRRIDFDILDAVATLFLEEDLEVFKAGDLKVQEPEEVRALCEGDHSEESLQSSQLEDATGVLEPNQENGGLVDESRGEEDDTLEALAALYAIEDQEATVKTEVELVTNDSDDNLPFEEEWRQPFDNSAQTGFTFESQNGLEFITVEPAMPLKVCQLRCSARIFYDGMEIQLHNCGCLLLLDDNFVAKVKLMTMGPLERAINFTQAAKALFRQLCITEIYVDKLLAHRNRLRSELLATMNLIRERTASDIAYAVDALQIFTLVQALRSLDYADLCRHLCGNTLISDALRNQTRTLLQIEEDVDRRNALLAKFHTVFANSTRELNDTLQVFRGAIVESRVKSLLDMAPDYLKEQLKGISRRALFQIHDNDVKVFHDMDKVLDKGIFGKALEDLGKRWSTKVKSNQGDRIVSAMNSIYFSLSRSLEELIVEITNRTDHKPEDLLQSDGNGWQPLQGAITWKTTSSLTKCLQQEYNFVFRLLKHFDPVTGSKNPFEYQPKRLLATETSALDAFLRPFRRMIGQTQQNPLRIADELYVWFCLLDDVLHHALPEVPLDTFEQILKDYVQLVSGANIEQMETIRVITHNTARFIVQTHPFVTAARSGEDKQILQLQLVAINRLVLGTESANIFRDLIDVFSGYWRNRCEIVELIPTKSKFPEMERIKNDLLDVVVVALGKDSLAGSLVDFFRSLNDFLVDLDNVSFDWLIKAVPKLTMSSVIDLKLVESVDNKWNGTANATYRVIEPNKFQQLIFLLLDGAIIPKLYAIDVMLTLLNYVNSQLNRTNWSAPDQISSSSVLISSMRSSLIYLREQPDYVSFDRFVEESTKPFGNVIENSRDMGDFVKRIALIKESFCYIRKQNEMSITEAMRMFRELNGEVNADRIMQAYARYSDQFEAYMAQPKEISKLVRGSAKKNLFNGWTAQFKQEELPKMLAGVAAAWSVLVSEDVSSTGTFFKPHCIQVLCVLRLLGADHEEVGVAKHLAQVLTGQGKSLVLALIATVLALTGHEIQVVCYNKYLVQRDARDFDEFYKLLGVKYAIRYGTFEDMANAIIAPEVNGKEKGLRSFVEDLLLSNSSNRRPNKPKTKVQDNSVLLMDEVDVFFTKKYYGSRLCPVTTPYIRGLGEIQEAIWKAVNVQKIHDPHLVLTWIQNYMSSSRFTNKKNFSWFLNRKFTYDLLVHDCNSYVRKSYNNKSLFTEHLNLMIVNAIQVATMPHLYTNYKINEEGVIAVKVGEKYKTTICSEYLNTFNYFRLKRNNFVPFVKNQDYNYSYLNLECGSISYAMLPKTFPLILGVTGTLSSLNQYEKATIQKLYSITNQSIMPSFFGCSNVTFNPAENFSHHATHPLWLSKIFTQAYAAAVACRRAAIIFFADGILLEEFRTQYSAQFDRLHILTENTPNSAQEALIGEAGIAKTVTLATRGMGRGVDYKSSVAVEKSGGVHVIQTFFSLDVKEETQIRGRTARKDNRGSYELILYDEHLKEQQLVVTGQERRVTYQGLDEARKNRALQENKDIEESIRMSTDYHAATLAYLQSFFR